jgi:hypothetical protein
MDTSSRYSLIDVDSLARYLTANVGDKKVKFVDWEGKTSPFWWPSLTFCTHEGSLYQLHSTGAVVGHDSNFVGYDASKMWVKVRDI